MSGGQRIEMRWSSGDTTPLYTSVWSVDSDVNEVRYRPGGPLAKLTIFYHKNRNAVLLGVGCVIVMLILLLGFSWYAHHSRNTKDQLVLTDTGILEVVSPSRLVSFEQGVKTSYGKYTEYIDEYINEYEAKQDSIGYINCTDKINWNSPSLDFLDPQYEGKKCRFPLKTQGTWCSRDSGFYGYHEGEPCILLKLNKLPPPTFPGWEADPNDPNQVSVKFSETQRHHLHEHKVAIICQGRDFLDKENIGPIRYYPQSFSKEYFRGENHIADPAPLIFIELAHPRDGTLISIRCEAWGIPEDAIDDTTNKVLIGRVTFELLMD